MRLTFYGVRGSIPTPGAEYIKYGGNTACVHIELNDGNDIIIDAGTGIRTLGQKLAAKEGDIHLLLTHNHWDHIQGFPFFTPIYQPQRNIFITPGQTTLAEHDNILRQMSGSSFPFLLIPYLRLFLLRQSLITCVSGISVRQKFSAKKLIIQVEAVHIVLPPMAVKWYTLPTMNCIPHTRKALTFLIGWNSPVMQT